jgi:hypothetical protein
LCPTPSLRAAVHHLPHRLQLVVAGEDHRLLDLLAFVVALLVDLQMEEARQQVEQAVALQHLFPEVGRR